MTQREINHALVDVIRYDYFWPGDENRDAVYGFTHSQEVNAICANMLPPHTVTPVDKESLEHALVEYLQRRCIGEEDAARIRAWLSSMPDEVAIIEREPQNPSSLFGSAIAMIIGAQAPIGMQMPLAPVVSELPIC